MNQIWGCRKPALAFAVNPAGLMYGLCVACAKMYMLMNNWPICLALGDRREWLMKPAFSEPRPYENNYRAWDDWLWWGGRRLRGANTLSLQTLTFIEQSLLLFQVSIFRSPFEGSFCSYKIPVRLLHCTNGFLNLCAWAQTHVLWFHNILSEDTTSWAPDTDFMCTNVSGHHRVVVLSWEFSCTWLGLLYHSAEVCHARKAPRCVTVIFKTIQVASLLGRNWQINPSWHVSCFWWSFQRKLYFVDALEFILLRWSLSDKLRNGSLNSHFQHIQQFSSTYRL